MTTENKGNTIIIQEWKDSSSISIFNQLLHCKRIVLKDVLSIWNKALSAKYSVDFVIMNSDSTEKTHACSFTELKKGLISKASFFSGNPIAENNRLKSLFEILYVGVEKCKTKQTYEYVVNPPYGFRAQDYLNRMDYGNEYCGQYLVKQGTLYGECSHYQISSMVFHLI